jgi:hypothetical protein
MTVFVVGSRGWEEYISQAYSCVHDDEGLEGREV